MSVRSVIELGDIPKKFSFSQYLAGIKQEDFDDVVNRDIVINDELLDPVYIITLALNEEGRAIRRGSFYYLPPRHDITYGHPCDLAFIDEDWDDLDCSTWDGMNWMQRLDLCAAINRIHGSESVIPICARILGYGGSFDATDDGNSSDSQPDSTKLSLGTSNSSPSSIQSTSSFDPAVRIGSSAYSRPMEDLSTFLIHYDKIGSTPFVCRSGAAEHHSLCDRSTTPGDISETFVRDIDHIKKISKVQSKSAASEVAKRAKKLVLEGYMPSNIDVVWSLLLIWENDSETQVRDRKLFGPTRFKWCELEDRINSDSDMRDINRMDFWPKI